ncbi:MAG: ECF transporter S component [Oscillospiraceae bacterium]|nr:ECF transporter S component [Oscillospiraceae bacterium]
MKNTSLNVGKMVRLAVLVAIIIIMAVTPLGFMMIGPVSITLMMIPVAIAAITVGPAGGATAGAVFGLTAFLRGFGLSPFATALMGINPIFTFVLMVITRLLAGLIAGLVYQALCGRKGKTAAALAACLAAPIANTVLFVGTLILLFGSTDYIMSTFGGTAWAVVGALVGTNALVEAGVGFIAGTAISRTLVHFFPGKPQSASAKKVSA